MTLFEKSRRSLVREAVKRGDARLLKTPEVLMAPPVRQRHIWPAAVLEEDVPTMTVAVPSAPTQPTRVVPPPLPGVLPPPPARQAAPRANPVADMDLLLAARNGNLAGVQNALLSGANVECTESNGRMTPLMNSAQDGTCAVLFELLSNGARLFTRNNGGKTAPMLSTIYGRQAAVELFISYKINLEDRDNEGKTILMHAAESGYKGIIKKLLAAGADVDAEDAGGQTALMWAAQKGNLAEAGILIANRATIHKVSRSGKTALQYAVKGGHGDVAKMLNDYTR
jgi:ankyrin repeat protein